MDTPGRREMVHSNLSKFLSRTTVSIIGVICKFERPAKAVNSTTTQPIILLSAQRMREHTGLFPQIKCNLTQLNTISFHDVTQGSLCMPFCGLFFKSVFLLLFPT